MGSRNREKKTSSKSVKKYMGSGLRIIDDGEESYSSKKESIIEKLRKVQCPSDSDEDEADELPQFEGIVDERPPHLRALEEFQLPSKWKKVEQSSSFQEIKSEPNSSSLNNSKNNEFSNDSDSSSSNQKSKDLSPPRAYKSKTTSTPSPPRRNRNQDLSPPRGYRNSETSQKSSIKQDSSPPRNSKNFKNRDSSPKRNRKRSISPSRRPKNYDRFKKSLSKSPPRRHHRSSKSPKREDKSRDSSEKGGKRMDKTLDGKKAGLQRASDLRQELAKHREKERENFNNMAEEISGRNAETVFRDREGKRRNIKDERRVEKEKERIKDEREAKYLQWGTGVKQVEGAEERYKADLHEMSKPLARYKDDEDLDSFLKEQERDGDPMLKFLTKKKGRADKPRYTGPPPLPNRFKIPPGYRWDGVDRSNGYEKKWFSRVNEKKAYDEEAYKWSVEDL